MSLLTYEDARPWARAIRENVVTRTMPPWHIDRNIGIRKFKDDPSLSDAEIATIVQWVDQGAPRGNPADLPPPRVFPEGNAWRHGTPDVVVEFPAYDLRATGPDILLNLLSDPGFTEDMWVYDVEVKPGDAATYAVIHHLTANLVEDPRVDPIGEVFGHYNMGMNPEMFFPDSGKLIRAGTQINWNMHLTPRDLARNSTTQGAKTLVNAQLGFKVFPKGKMPKYEAIKRGVGGAGNEELDIRPNAVTMTEGFTQLQKPALIYGFMAHMHYHGRATCLEAIYPVGPTGSDTPRKETLSCVSKYDAGWQQWYHYAEDVVPLLPAGTILRTLSWFDNTPNNKVIANPRNWIGWGQRTIEEMDQPRVGIIYLDEQDFQARAAARASQRGSSTN
jgi:hypothetical protein